MYHASVRAYQSACHRPRQAGGARSCFQAALEKAGGQILHFGRVAQVLEGDESPFPIAGVLEFATLAQALAFYNSEQYEPIKAERREAQEARMFVVETG
ncbi:DUF1330 domain-containing protein [Rhizobium giardinii]|uniref:DUF1330 domain-containing protein n=1 Tax=Rhizobium giardinii TaxID=56731 RepID=UPI001AEBE849